jgi:hypothetical protein
MNSRLSSGGRRRILISRSSIKTTSGWISWTGPARFPLFISFIYLFKGSPWRILSPELSEQALGQMEYGLSLIGAVSGIADGDCEPLDSVDGAPLSSDPRICSCNIYLS